MGDQKERKGFEETLNSVLEQSARLAGDVNKVEERLSRLEQKAIGKQSKEDKKKPNEQDISKIIEDLTKETKNNREGLEQFKKETKKKEDELSKRREEDARKKEKEFEILKKDFEALKGEKENLKRKNDSLSQEVNSLKGENQKSKDEMKRVLKYLQALEEEKMRREQEEGLSSLKKISLDVFSDSKSTETSLKGPLMNQLDKYFSLSFRNIKDKPSEIDSQATAAVIILFAPTDRWFDSFGSKEASRGFQEKYGSNVYIFLLKPLGDATKLRMITDNQGFAAITQLLVSSDLKLLSHSHNDEQLKALFARIHQAYSFEINQADEAVRRATQQKISLKNFGLGQ